MTLGHNGSTRPDTGTTTGAGIELELHSGRPATKRASRDTLLRGSYRHGGALARELSRFDRHGSGRLGWVDPYGDPLFNDQEARAACVQVDTLIRECRRGTKSGTV